MFPIPWNRTYRKKDGSLANIDDVMSGGGGGGSLPPHSAADAGKVLSVTNDGSLAWVEVSGGATSYKATSVLLPENIAISAEEVTT